MTWLVIRQLMSTVMVQDEPLHCSQAQALVVITMIWVCRAEVDKAEDGRGLKRRRPAVGALDQRYGEAFGA